MRQQRKIWSWVLVSFWGALFTLGIYQVFLFLHGFPLFSFGSENTQSGYATFESDSSLFLDDVYLGAGEVYQRYPLGKYDLCLRSLKEDGLCFNDVHIQSNEYSSLVMKGLVSLPLDLESKKVFLTDQKIYSLPKDNGFFWYQSDKKQIFWWKKGMDSVSSYFPSFPVDTIEWNDEDEVFVISGEKDGVRSEEVLSLFSDFFDFSSFAHTDTPFLFEDFGILKNEDNGVKLKEGEMLLIAQFDEALERSIPLESTDSTLLVFPSSVYLFSENGEFLRSVIQKDEGSPLWFASSSRTLFFMSSSSLWSLSL